MKSYTKSINRTFKNNIGRFFAITAIILLGLAITSGLGALSPITRTSVSDYLNQQNISDIIIKSTTEPGFSSDEIEKIYKLEGVSELQVVSSLDLNLNDLNSRIVSLSFKNNNVNKLELIEGRLPEAGDEIVVERQTKEMEEFKVGENVVLFGSEMKIVGIVGSPLIFSKEGEPDLVNQENLDVVYYINSDVSVFPLPKTDVYLKLSSTKNMNVFNGDYIKKVEKNVGLFKEFLGEETIEFLTLEQNKSYKVTEGYTEKIQKISLVFPIFILAVSVLVVLTTMTRLIEEERQIIGCYKTLGYSNRKIMLKYINFSLVACIIGSIFGLVLGIFLIPYVIYPGFNTILFLPEMAGYFDVVLGVVVMFIMILAIVGVTSIVSNSVLKEKPADLLRPKVPKAGKKIFLERIPFVWNRLKFKYKSSLRNIFRYKKHLIMTLVSVAGSTAIVIAGFSLFNATLTSNKMGAVADAVSPISTVIIIFACALCVLVIYNLTNINIAERTREIATLKVLGYHQSEVSGYIYREIFIMTLMGIALGIPVGCGLVYFIFTYLDIGVISDVSWWAYLSTVGILLILIGLIDLLLLNKIKKVDMNSSLKMID